jgi:hypothetical protein
MDKSQEAMIKNLESTPLEQARLEIALEKCGNLGISNHALASSWLAAKPASIRDEREERTLSIARRSNKIAIAAMILSTAIAISMIVIQLLTTK